MTSVLTKLQTANFFFKELNLFNFFYRNCKYYFFDRNYEYMVMISSNFSTSFLQLYINTASQTCVTYEFHSIYFALEFNEVEVIEAQRKCVRKICVQLLETSFFLRLFSHRSKIISLMHSIRSLSIRVFIHSFYLKLLEENLST